MRTTSGHVTTPIRMWNISDFHMWYGNKLHVTRYTFTCKLHVKLAHITCEKEVRSHVIIINLTCDSHANHMWQHQFACETSVIFTCDTETNYMWPVALLHVNYMWNSRISHVKRGQTTCDNCHSHMWITCEPHATKSNHMWNMNGVHMWYGRKLHAIRWMSHVKKRGNRM